ncbi:transporter, SSS family, putative [Verrucomicrobiia bacterium DG1235]|nr:transporter, SSS family, putative [Verrucomicrobiae bacterium DG1235]
MDLDFVGSSFSLYLYIAWRSRVKSTKEFYVAGRGVPAAANGMATAADWMSAASFIGMAGLISTMGYAGGVYLMGWTGGYVLLALLLAPYLRKSGRFTVPEFVGDRYESNTARVVAVVCAIFVSFTYVAGQMRGVGVVFSRFLEVDINVGIIIGMAIVFIYATLGGMKGITYTQVAQYWVLITAFLVPAIAISIKLTGTPIPQIGLGSTINEDIAGQPGVYLLEKLNQIQADFGFSSYTDAFTGSWDKWNVFFVTLALMAGTAGLPHVIVRFYTVKNIGAARWSAFWALLFISLLYLTAPATGAFARYYMLETLNGAQEENLPDWFVNWERTGLVTWLDDGDGVVRYSNDEYNEIYNKGTSGEAFVTIRELHALWLGSKGARGEDGRVALQKYAKTIGPDRDIIVLATPEMAELANWIIAFVAAGGLAAALSTASGLLLVISSSVSHDLYARIIAPGASDAKKLVVGRTTIGLAVVVAGVMGINPPGFVGEVVAFAFGLAASSFFPILILGIFSKRVGTVPAICGMLAGIGFTSYYIIGVQFLGMERWDFGLFESGINPQGIGSIGMMVNFIVTLGLSRFFPAPGKSAIALIDAIREPEEAGPAVDIESAMDH